MARLLRYKIDDDNEIWVEVEAESNQIVSHDNEDGTILLEASETTLVEKVELSKVLESIKPLVNAVLGKVGEIKVRPQEVRLDLGINFDAEVGVILAKAKTGANLAINLKWNLEVEQQPEKSGKVNA